MSGPDYADYVERAFASYTPKFRVLDDEPWDIAFAAAALAKAELPKAEYDALQRQRFLSIAQNNAYFARIVDRYEAEGKYDRLEAHAKPNEWGSQLPLDEHLAVIDRLAAAGHHAGILRIWRHFIAKIGDGFWYWVRERDAALKREARGKPLPLGASPSAQCNEFIPSEKETLLAILRMAEPAFAEYGSPRDQAWLEKQRTESEAERREVLTGKPDPAPMTDALFWQIIAEGGDTTGDRLDTLADRLAAYTPKAIKTFGQMVTDRTADAYRAEIWALAYLLMHGASDDAFEAFRNWLLLQGRDLYEATLANPDEFDAAGLTETPMAEGLLSPVEQAYEMRAGKPMPRLRQPKTKIGDLDEDAFPAMLPKVAEATA